MRTLHIEYIILKFEGITAHFQGIADVNSVIKTHVTVSDPKITAHQVRQDLERSYGDSAEVIEVAFE
jgi:hypothetical protein